MDDCLDFAAAAAYYDYHNGGAGVGGAGFASRPGDPGHAHHANGGQLVQPNSPLLREPYPGRSGNH